MLTEEIKNFVMVSDLVATAGQPSEVQLQDLARDGYQTIINLGLMDPRYCLADEAGAVRDAGMQYHHIPVEFSAPQPAQLEAFFAVMDASAGRKVLVHCAANYRVSCFVALYGQARWDWTTAQAEALIARTWNPDAVWRSFMHQAGAPAIANV